MTEPEFIQRVLRDAGGAVQLKSQAMRPLHVLLITIATSSVALMFADGIWKQIFGAILLAAAMAVYVYAYFFWAKKDPDRLGSEAFIVQRDVIKFTQQTKFPAQMPLDTTAIEDPSRPMIDEESP